MTEPTDRQLAEAIAADSRLAAVRIGVSIEHDLREYGPLTTILEMFKKDAERAVKEFAYVSLGDHRAVMDCQARIYRAARMVDMLNIIRERAGAAEKSLRDEDDSRRGQEAQE